MGVIRIQERAAGEHETTAVVSFEHGVEYPIQIRDPFADDPKQETDLEWYFEEYLTFPFTQDVRARNAAKSIQHYGESLFAQVFTDPGAFAAYKQARQQGLHTLQIEIAGSSAFQRLHWEALYDPEFEEYLSLHAAMVRKNITPQTLPATLQSTATINVLVVVARPGGSRDVGYRTISRPLMDELEKTKLPVEVTLLRPGTYQALVTHLEQTTRAYGMGHYHLVHFDVHGALLEHTQLERGAQMNRYLYLGRFGRPALEAYTGEKAFLFLEGEQDEQADLVEAGELARLLRQHQIPMVLLNACQSGKLSGEMETSLGNRLIQAGVQTVVAMGYSVTVSAAEVLMQALYQALFEQKSLPEALCLARQVLANRKERRVFFNQIIELEDWLLPILYQNQAVQFALQPFTPQEETTFFEVRAAQYRPPQQPSYGFVGRDLDILHIEKRLLLKRNLLLIRGMGGAGKTTLLHHLATWWQRTGLVQGVFYFGYDERAWNRQQIMHTVARKLLDKHELLTFQSLSLDARQVQLTQLLKSTRYLLILDNLESITGLPLATQHTLSGKEQEALRLLLADLVGGQTLVVLGSRSTEKWLSKETFEENCYELAGLDQEAASQLAERILERHGATRYRQDKALPALLKLLDGFPLALEVVLANLVQQTPSEVIAALHEGGADLQVGESEKRTENILRCIDYSHSNLLPEAQQLLLCLAPYTSVILVRKSILNNYVDELRHQPPLSALPFDRLPEVIREAQNWGLMSPDPNMPNYLHLHPIFPYFLRNRLYTPEHAETQAAIEIAFRLHYDNLANMLCQLLMSKNPNEQQIGQLLTKLEYENLATALRLALEAHGSILFPYLALSSYLEAIRDHQRAMELGQMVLTLLKNYTPEELAGPLGKEFASVIDDVAMRQLELNLYEEAEASYQKALSLLLDRKSDDSAEIEQSSASIYHQLGRVAQEQRQWQKAEQYFRRALQTCIKYDDRYMQAEVYHHLGTVALQENRWQQVEQYYQQALQIYKEHNDHHSQADVFHNLGVAALHQGQWQQAEQYYLEALKIYIEHNDHHRQAGVYHQMGRVAQEQREWEQAEQYYQQALQIYVDSNDRYRQAGTYHNLGIVAQGQREWEQAEQYYQQALQISIETNNRYVQAGAYHQLGVVAQEQREWEQAEQYYQQALQISIETNNRNEQASIYRNLGIVAQDQEKWKQAEQYYQQALQIYGESIDRDEQASMYYQMGRIAQEQREWEQAEQYYQQALQIYGESNNRYEQASVYHQMGRMAQEQRKWEQAEQYYRQALPIYVESNNRNERARTCFRLGFVTCEQRKWEQAEQYYQQALPIFGELSNYIEQAHTYHNLGMMAQKQQKWEQAEHYYQQALQIYGESNNRSEQASMYFQMGVMAQRHQQWEQAEHYYQQALQIFGEFNNRNEQASTYNNLGIITSEQQKWEQAEQYYQQALRIYIEFQDRYSQASIYHQLGIVAQQQRQWKQAERQFLEALRIFAEYNNTRSAGQVFRSLARLWPKRREIDLLKEVASVLESNPEEIEELFRRVTQSPSDQPKETGG